MSDTEPRLTGALRIRVPTAVAHAVAELAEHELTTVAMVIRRAIVNDLARRGIAWRQNQAGS
jgi:hypothetical protein